MHIFYSYSDKESHVLTPILHTSGKDNMFEIMRVSAKETCGITIENFANGCSSCDGKWPPGRRGYPVFGICGYVQVFQNRQLAYAAMSYKMPVDLAEKREYLRVVIIC